MVTILWIGVNGMMHKPVAPHSDILPYSVAGCPLDNDTDSFNDTTYPAYTYGSGDTTMLYITNTTDVSGYDTDHRY